ncbi:ABC-2 type transport system permease protein [Actinoalloteichus hoggarensis]|uniref:Transport permease protein n=1 Tax=Actinoalloteichus hoggarensis TaxID=1470176 RepID=A0A221VZS1_9PSEU|nr:ABC transporter permease [Actinoalloteichus hoggarensis]ASO18801.1 Daunorubicin/doxorubicin resistance ABC transporter permease protein DrrB [Actinoalloteichus hoggarensis]MBB5920034.1 ABC-2 type transport system permease protein [Actinoalloteichus hoggarensis]
MRTSLLGDVVTVFSRELRPVLRSPFSILVSLVQPLFFLALFMPLLPADVGGDTAALAWFVPGVIVMSCLFGTSTTGSNLQFEMQTGSHERLLVSPLRRPALIIGRSLKEIVPVVAQAVIILIVAVPLGLRPDPLGVVAGLVILAVFCVGLGALSFALALAARNQEWMFWTVQQTLLFPLMLLGGMLLPVDDGPGWLRTVAAFNPLSYVVEAQRALFDGEILSATVGAGALAAVSVAAVGLLIGVRGMRQA